MVNYELIKKMFELQDTFNEYTVKNWKNEELPWHRAIWRECGEALDSTPWKWWKKGETDIANLEVELVDIWHFVMSYLMTTNFDIRNNPQNYYDLFEGNFNRFEIKDLLEDMASLSLERNYNFEIDKMLIPIFFCAWSEIGRSQEDLYKSYIIKNVLNKFRQDNGYKDGSYIKMWTKSEGIVVEDNVIAWELSHSIDNLENMFDELYIKLDNFYKKM